MPYLRIQTNLELSEAKKNAILPLASNVVSSELGKPENYVMVSFAPPQPMMFAGSNEPCAYLELKSIGLPESRTKHLSSVLCRLMESELELAADRVYVEFTDAARSMWGWNGGTF
ncbi:MAG: phenylpyruvate tautomerase MIF-related protein [Gammaproteobacteria bacterium]|nr:MAG: phenylpyruvate tautomerase MIF-related protein [Gammaproteobacteria bacterium]